MIRWLQIGVFVLASSAAQAASVVGAGRPIDSDSLMVGQQEVRLHGIDAPELTQTCTRGGASWACGKVAAEELARLIAGRQVNCTSLGEDLHGRLLARCRVGETELNRAMVAAGYALAYRRYSTSYVSAEGSAKLARRGIWSGAFEQPSEVRNEGQDYRVAVPKAGRPLAPERSVLSPSKSQPSGGCRIKGNQSRRGTRIYHLPGMPYYAETVAEEIFCTEAEARTAGYRRSKADQHR